MINPSGWEMFFILLFIILLCATALLLVLAHENVPWRTRRAYLRRFLGFWFGISVVLIYKLEHNSGRLYPLPPNFIKEWRLHPNGLLLPKSSVITEDERFETVKLDHKPVIFITPTEYSALQYALLTRIGEALYPVRHIVRWIVVQLTLSASPFNDQVVAKEGVNGSNITFKQATHDRDDLTQLQLKNIDKLLSRFGVPYTLLSSHGQLNFTWKGVDLGRRVPFHISKAYLVGLLWAIRNLNRGVILLGDEMFAYDSALFWELRKTKIASCWPVAFGMDEARIGMPIAKKIKHSEKQTKIKILGYESDKLYKTLPIHRSGIAVDLEHLQKSVPYKNYWKIIYDKPFTIEDLSIKLSEVQVLGWRGSAIYVWRITTEEQEWPTRIKVWDKLFWRQTETNLVPLLKRSFGPRFYVTQDLLGVTQNRELYPDYDVKKHVGRFL